MEPPLQSIRREFCPDTLAASENAGSQNGMTTDVVNKGTTACFSWPRPSGLTTHTSPLFQ